MTQSSPSVGQLKTASLIFMIFGQTSLLRASTLVLGRTWPIRWMPTPLTMLMATLATVVGTDQLEQAKMVRNGTRPGLVTGGQS